MTAKEAYNVIKKAYSLLLQAIAGFQNLHKYAEACATLEMYLDKYRWHDLRKNPDDLPTKEYEVVEVWTKNRIVDICIFNKAYGFRPWYSTDEVYVPEDMYNPETDIIAWREIEPFEGGERMINEEVARYEEITGEDAKNVSVARIGGFLDGYDKAMEKYKWHHRPEGGWTKETLPEHGTDVVCKIHLKTKIKTINDIISRWDEICDDLFINEPYEFKYTAWMYIPPA